MVGEKMAAVRDDLGSSTAVAGVIGTVCGVIVAFASVAVNGSPDQGFFAPMFDNALALSVIIAAAVVLGGALGFCIGALEGAIAFMLAHRSAKTFRHLPTFAAVLSLSFVLVNATVAALATGFAYDLSGTRSGDFFAPALSGAMTVVAVLAFARLQASDWPEWRERAHTNPTHYAEVLDLNAEESTLRHERLADRVRDRILEEDRRAESRKSGVTYKGEPTLGLPRADRTRE